MDHSENKKICDCPYYKNCHEPRQFVQKEIVGNDGEKIKDCWFYQEFKKDEWFLGATEQNPTINI